MELLVEFSRCLGIANFKVFPTLEDLEAESNEIKGMQRRLHKPERLVTFVKNENEKPGAFKPQRYFVKVYP
jgi:hypothetical protein